eukprot:CAMPEP_0202896640 /NCGR_PEP_ID=MMETSP1392-20130828/5604_1 /ASSEMBLY_ACC=CAM_ASM_000868 /TAXON_ID=225041 /ORGANISM="Chlamydomonas chlamydogama, Strain SAG 11-48b" /LENGTH=555 /DNA_ID=CAMNT_0049582065 /DNA_START=123 /DNA_END=1790 /DNA_ORIENTATION=-
MSFTLPYLPSRFTHAQRIAEGQYYDVFRAYDSSFNNWTVLKLVRRSTYKTKRQLYEREVASLWKLSLYRHPHIVELREYFVTNEHVGLVVELCDHQSTLEHLLVQLESGNAVLTVQQAASIFGQVVSALAFAHAHRITHRDVRTPNILIQHLPGGQLHAKLGGWTISKVQDRDTQPRTRSTIKAVAIAPELLTSKESQAYDGQALDVWASGVLLFELMFGGHPFIPTAELEAASSAQSMRLVMGVMMNNSVTGNIQLDAQQEADNPQLVELLRGMLYPDPARRLRAADVIAHPWFASNVDPQVITALEYFMSGAAPAQQARQTQQQIEQLMALARSDIMLPQLGPMQDQVQQQQYMGYMAQPGQVAPRQSPFAVISNPLPTVQHQPQAFPSPVPTGAAVQQHPSLAMPHLQQQQQQQQQQVFPLHQQAMPAPQQQQQQQQQMYVPGSQVMAQQQQQAFVPQQQQDFSPGHQAMSPQQQEQQQQQVWSTHAIQVQPLEPELVEVLGPAYTDQAALQGYGTSNADSTTPFFLDLEHAAHSLDLELPVDLDKLLEGLE